MIRNAFVPWNGKSLPIGHRFSPFLFCLLLLWLFFSLKFFSTLVHRPLLIFFWHLASTAMKTVFYRPTFPGRNDQIFTDFDATFRTEVIQIILTKNIQYHLDTMFNDLGNFYSILTDSWFDKKMPKLPSKLPFDGRMKIGRLWGEIWQPKSAKLILRKFQAIFCVILNNLGEFENISIIGWFNKNCQSWHRGALSPLTDSPPPRQLKPKLNNSNLT